MTAARSASRDLSAEVSFLTRALKAPALRESAARLADRARAESWTHEEFLVACLQREVAAREEHGGEGRIRAARFPAHKSLEDFDYDHARGLRREVIAHLGTLDFVAAKDNVIFLGPPGTGKTHLATGLAIRACQAGRRVAFATAAGWVARLAAAHHAGRLHAELNRMGIVGVVVKGLLYLLIARIVVFLGALLLAALRMRRRPGRRPALDSPRHMPARASARRSHFYCAMPFSGKRE
jgi:DNA replication protein DnaC